MAKDHIQLSSSKAFGQINIKKDVFYAVALLAIQEEKRATLDKKSFRYAVDVDVVKNELNLKLDVKVQYGKNVNDVCNSLQEKISTQVEQMTGLVVKKIDVNVIGFTISAQ
jgi:uncharacterized alkaline shock family protein YloU